MSAKINSDWAAVAEYFRLFRYGITTSSAKAQPNFHKTFTSSKSLEKEDVGTLVAATRTSATITEQLSAPRFHIFTTEFRERI
ncbi:hypothetical protein F442_21468 [Phytophthora nicotianae P10297]|uniref:Uncharacterized protein n=1 Tax=Phytophthora nicotianae P10297 TaxID=1317064 RepID=W2Y3S6_PHYNI|nr:hypothetical protein F442_21468 [Phytophthora nicotianae P10297]